MYAYQLGGVRVLFRGYMNSGDLNKLRDAKEGNFLFLSPAKV